MPKLAPEEIERRRKVILAAPSRKAAAEKLKILPGSVDQFCASYMPTHRWPRGRKKMPAPYVPLRQRHPFFSGERATPLQVTSDEDD